MTLVQELFGRGNSQHLSFKFTPERDPDATDVQQVQWFWFLIGYAGGGLLMRLYTLVLEKMHAFSEGSERTFLLCMLAFLLVDILSNTYLISPAITMKLAQIDRCVLWW